MNTDNTDDVWFVVFTIIMIVLMVIAVSLLSSTIPDGKDPARPTPIDGKCKEDLTEESQWDMIKGFGDGARTQHGTRVMFAPVPPAPELVLEDAHDEHIQMMKEMWNR